jgi:hypothetical protein
MLLTQFCEILKVIAPIDKAALEAKMNKSNKKNTDEGLEANNAGMT